MTILLRATKGSELSHSELDENFSDLDNRTKASWQNQRGLVSTNGIPFPPTQVIFNGVYVPSFDSSNIQEETVIFNISHDYVANTPLKPHGHTIIPSNAGGVVVWGFSMIFALEDSIFSQSQSFEVQQTILPNSQGLHFVIKAPFDLVIPNLNHGSIIILQVFRNSTSLSDTYPDDIILISVDMAYRSNSFGSENP